MHFLEIFDQKLASLKIAVTEIVPNWVKKNFFAKIDMILCAKFITLFLIWRERDVFYKKFKIEIKFSFFCYIYFFKLVLLHRLLYNLNHVS